MILAMSVPDEKEATEFADFLEHFRPGKCEALVTSTTMGDGKVWAVQVEGFDLVDVSRLAAAFDAGWRRAKSNPK